VLPVLPILCHGHPDFSTHSSMRGTPPIRLVSRYTLRFCVTALPSLRLHEASAEGCFYPCFDRSMATASRCPLVMTLNRSPSESPWNSSENCLGGPVVKPAEANIAAGSSLWVQENMCSAATPRQNQKATTASGQQLHGEARVWTKFSSASNNPPVTFAKEAAINGSLVLTCGCHVLASYTARSKCRPQVLPRSNTAQSQQ